MRFAAALAGVAVVTRAGLSRYAWSVADTTTRTNGSNGSNGSSGPSVPDAASGAGAPGGSGGSGRPGGSDAKPAGSDGKPGGAPAGKPTAKADAKPARETVALVGFAAPVFGLVEPALTGDGYTVERIALDADTVRALVRSKPRVVVLDCHPYVDARALHADLRGAPELAESAVVAVGPPEAPEVPGLEVVRQPGRALELDRLLQAIHRAAGRYTG